MNVQLFVAGVSAGIIYDLIITGMALTFRSVGVMNFVQGELLMFGGYFYYISSKILNLPITLSLILVSLSMGVAGIPLMGTSYWPPYNAQVKAVIASATGMSIVFKEGARFIWGSTPVTVDQVARGTVRLGQATIQWQNMAIIAISATAMTLVYMLLEKTFVGNAMQVTAQDQYMASLIGASMIVSIDLTFVLPAMITRIGGGLLTPIFLLNNTMGATASAKAFVATVAGGSGSVLGAVLRGLIVGLVKVLGGTYISSMHQLALIYVVPTVVLAFRPQGIFSEKIQEKA